MENKNTNITIDENDKSKMENDYSKYSIINTKNEYSIPGVEISKDNKLIPTNSFYSSNIFTLNIDSSLLEKPSKYFYRKKGNTYQFFGNSNGDPFIIIGPQWFMIIGLTFFISFIFYGIQFYFWLLIPFYIKIIGFVLYLLFLFSYLYTALINPGFPLNNEESKIGEPKEKFRFCDICKIYVNIQLKTVHCVDCDICIEGLDHHCPWTSKCIGKRNYKSFSVFVCSVFTLIVYFFIAVSSIHFKK
jgi:hypothetical protein